MKKCGQISSTIKYFSIFKTRNLKIYLHTKLNAEKNQRLRLHTFSLFLLRRSDENNQYKLNVITAI